MDNYIRKFKLIRVVDGDTIRAFTDNGYREYTERGVRLLGIDTPELTAKDPIDRENAQKARQFVIDWFNAGTEFHIASFKSDSFDRWLGVIYDNNGRCLNNDLLKSGLAKEYVR